MSVSSKKVIAKEEGGFMQSGNVIVDFSLFPPLANITDKATDKDAKVTDKVGIKKQRPGGTHEGPNQEGPG